jgi:membrane-bound lytic murein transglycosylase F
MTHLRPSSLPRPLLVLAFVALAVACDPKTSTSAKTPSDDSHAPQPATATPAPPKAPAVAMADLDGIKAAKVLRVGVFGGSSPDQLPRNGSPDRAEQDLIALFAESQDVAVATVAVETFTDLFDHLAAGKIDIAAARITVTEQRKAKVAFTRPLKVVSEMVVGRDGGPAPTTIEELSGKTIHVRPGSSYATSLKEASAVFSEKGRVAINVVEVPAHLDDTQVVHLVADGQADLAVIDSDSLDSIQTYESRVKALFPLKEGRQIAWAMRPANKQLLAAADAFLIERAMTGHTRQTFAGDLDGIKKRKVLRVLTRNNGVTYYLHRGVQLGFDYELVKKMAKDLGVRLEVVVPPKASDLIGWLNDGRGDIIAAAWTITDKRAAQIAFSTPYLHVDELLVGKQGAAGNPATLAEIKGKTIAVRKGSSYAATLASLQAEHGPFTVTEVPANVETETLLAQVAAGEVALTVCDSHILAVEQAYRPELVQLVKLTQAPDGALDARGKPRDEARSIAFGMRKDAPELQAFVNRWVKKNYRGLEYNVIKNKYFKNARRAAEQGAAREQEKDRISPYDDLIKKYAAQYQLDWRLMAAQAYQESRFNPQAKSWVGALGLFQVMPATGKEMGFVNLKDPEIGTHAGIKYMHRMIDAFEPTLPLKQRVRFALASYNAGRGHVIDARRLARQKGWDPDRWFDNVEKAMLLLKERKYARKARHGYCRGDEPVQYVSKIQSRYDAYAAAFPER